MFIYQFLLSAVILCFMLQGIMEQKTRNILYIIICVIMLFVIAVRGDTMGGDVQEYRYIFSHPKASLSFTEPGLLIVNRIIRLFTTNVYIASVIKAFLCLTPLFFFFFKIIKIDLFTALFLFMTFSWEGGIFLLEFSAERQCFAIACFSLFLYIYTNNNYKYNWSCILWLGLMVMFHYSSVVVILLLLLQLVKIKKTVYFTICIIASVSLYFVGAYLAPLVQVAENMGKGFYLSAYGAKDLSVISLFPFVGVFIISLFFMPNDKINTIWFKGFFLSTILTAFMMPMGENISRMCAYFYLCSFVSIPMTFKVIKQPLVRYCFIAIVYVYFTHRFLHVLDIMTEVENGMVPYETFF